MSPTSYSLLEPEPGNSEELPRRQFQCSTYVPTVTKPTIIGFELFSHLLGHLSHGTKSRIFLLIIDLVTTAVISTTKITYEFIDSVLQFGTLDGIRTHVTSLRCWHPGPLDDKGMKT
jgi:hypothetical protein